jgi:hypothetical protein
MEIIFKVAVIFEDRVHWWKYQEGLTWDSIERKTKLKVKRGARIASNGTGKALNDWCKCQHGYRFFPFDLKFFQKKTVLKICHSYHGLCCRQALNLDASKAISYLYVIGFKHQLEAQHTINQSSINPSWEIRAQTLEREGWLDFLLTHLRWYYLSIDWYFDYREQNCEKKGAWWQKEDHDGWYLNTALQAFIPKNKTSKSQSWPSSRWRYCLKLE